MHEPTFPPHKYNVGHYILLSTGYNSSSSSSLLITWVQTNMHFIIQSHDIHHPSTITVISFFPWWHHQMETFYALLAICAGNSLVTVESSTQRPMTGSFDVFFDLLVNKRLNKQSWGWRFDTPSRPLRRHYNPHTHTTTTTTRARTQLSRYNACMQACLPYYVLTHTRVAFSPCLCCNLVIFDIDSCSYLKTVLQRMSSITLQQY